MIETNLIEDLRLLAPPNYAWVAWMALLVGATMVAVALWRATRRRRMASGGPSPGSVPRWELALSELDRLLPLLLPERSREYGIEATTVLRRYIEERYELHAPRLATEEFLVTVGHSASLPALHRDSLGRFLELCDLFKFGRYIANAEELRRLHAAAVEFVLASKPAPAAAPAAGGSA